MLFGILQTQQKHASFGFHAAHGACISEYMTTGLDYLVKQFGYFPMLVEK